MAQVKLKGEKILSDEHYTLKKVSFYIQKKDGSWQQQEREVYDHGNAVTVLLYNKSERKVILVSQFRIASYLNGNESGMLIEACAGLLKKNEDPKNAMIREIEEETGYVVSDIEKIYEAFSSAGAYTEKIYYYIGAYDQSQKKGKGGGLEDEQEELQVMELPFDEAMNMIQNGEIKDAKTIMLLQYAKLKGLL
ncbi:MAG TPA: NUDIX domain-containing protein [Flavisolibacter sp.]|nr:NUDIX domain-containing protein [Flavisolibacter sp.]